MAGGWFRFGGESPEPQCCRQRPAGIPAAGTAKAFDSVSGNLLSAVAVFHSATLTVTTTVLIRPGFDVPFPRRAQHDRQDQGEEDVDDSDAGLDVHEDQDDSAASQRETEPRAPGHASEGAQVGQKSEEFKHGHIIPADQISPG